MKDVPLNLNDGDLFSVLLDRHKIRNNGETNQNFLAKFLQVALKIFSALKFAPRTRDVAGD
jgi:hypothetical protein